MVKSVGRYENKNEVDGCAGDDENEMFDRDERDADDSYG